MLKNITEFAYLKANDFDGLTSGECGCRLKDFMPCGFAGIEMCEPAYSWKAKAWNKANESNEYNKTDDDAEFVMSTIKPEKIERNF